MYQTIFARIVGAVFGYVVGFRFLANSLVLMVKGLFLGFNPKFFHTADGLLPKAITNFPRSITGKAFGIVFGFGIGLYPLLNLLSVALKGLWFGIYPELFVKDQHLLPIGNDKPYHTIIGRVFGGVAGGFLGLFGVINTMFLIVWGFFYGALGEKHLKNGVLGKPVYPLRTPFGLAFGCVFGLFFGLRSLLDVILTFVVHFWKYMSILWDAISAVLRYIYRVILRNLGRIFKFIALGFWYGAAPAKCHLRDGLFPEVKLDEEELSKVGFEKACMSIGSVFALGIGLRAIINFLSMLPRAAWHGPFPPTWIVDDGFPFLTFPRRPLETIIAKVFGTLLGFGFGIRSYVKILGICLRGAWFGAFPALLTMKDGLLAEPRGEVYRTLCGLSAGWCCGLVVGWRSFVSFLTVVPKGIWLGVAPEFFKLTDGWMTASDAGEWLSPFGRVTGICGIIVGLQFFCNCVFLCLHAMWVGCLPAKYFFIDGILGPPRKVMRSPIGIALGATLGIVFGWRNVVDFVLLGLRSAWYGQWGRLYSVFPPATKLQRNIDGSLSIMSDPSPSDDSHYQTGRSYQEAGTRSHGGSRRQSKVVEPIQEAEAEQPIEAPSPPAQELHSRRVHPTSAPTEVGVGPTRRKTLIMSMAITEEAPAVNEENPAEPASDVPITQESASQPEAKADALPIYIAEESNEVKTPPVLSSPTSAATITPLDDIEAGSDPGTNPPHEKEIPKTKQMQTEELPEAVGVPPPLTENQQRQWWSKMNYQGSPTFGRSDEDWLQHGATTTSAKIAGPVVFGLLLAAAGWLLSWYLYVPSNHFRIPPVTPDSIWWWWYERTWPSTAVIAGCGLVLGVTTGTIGVRNAFNPLFYSRTVLPLFIVKVWFPALLPLLELLAVALALAIYFPILCIGSTMRRTIRSTWFLMRALVFALTGGSVRIMTRENRRKQQLRVTGIKVFKSFLRLLVLAAGIFVIAIILMPIMMDPTKGNMDVRASATIGVAMLVVLIPILDLTFKFLMPSYRFKAMTERSLSRLIGVGLTAEEAVDLDKLIVARISSAKIGSSATDPAGPLRVWIRAIGVWSEDEVRLKRIHNVYRGYLDEHAHQGYESASASAEERGNGAPEMVFIRGLAPDDRRRVAEAQHRRRSSVAPFMTGSNPNENNWSRRVSEALMPGLRRSSEGGGKTLGYFSDKLEGKPLGELFEVGNVIYRIHLESDIKLWIWTWSIDADTLTPV
ncbi:hypothetical protein HDU97_006923 [Phlyctochytrium planicorne]|nr:hypothetical protein HDU97_006923 [Phlyctochytrium planicorne]